MEGKNHIALHNKSQYIFAYQPLKEIMNNGGVVIKGCPLSLLAYSGPNIRYSSDIDVLINKEKLQQTYDILVKYGFTQIGSNSPKNARKNRIICLSCSHQVLPFVKQISGNEIRIDVNFDVFWGEYQGANMNINEFISDSITVNINGYSVKTLSPLKALIQLILHHYKDMNSIFLLATRKSIKHEMFKDVYYLLKNNLDAIPLDKLYAMSTEYEIIPFVFYVLYYTGQVFEDEILKQFIEAFRTSEGEELLNCYGLCTKERKEWKYDFKTRLESENLYELIKDDLTDKDRKKIAINKRVFMGVSE